MTNQVEITQVAKFLQTIIEKRLNKKEWEWFEQQTNKLENNFQSRTFYLTFSSAPRFIGKHQLRVTQEEAKYASQLREGFHLESWNLLQCVRTYFLLLLPHEDPQNFISQINQLHETADFDEQVSLYAALPLLPHPELLSRRATEGIRTNITDVFDAIALHNPYPHDYLAEGAWNQMVLKAVFMQRPLYRIYGADDRVNEELARMLIDFAHERWAANRQVTPELWRFVGPFLNEDTIPDIKKTLEGDVLEKKAGLLACSSSRLPEALELLNQHPHIKKDIETGQLNWNTIGQKQENLAQN